MKVIDLLNKIANGEDVPEFIEVTNYFTKENEMSYTHTDNIFHCLDNGELRLNSIISAVEDKEEKNEKPIQELKNRRFTRNQKQIAGKINEIIREVNKLKKEDE